MSPVWRASCAGSVRGWLLALCLVVPGCRLTNESHRQQYSDLPAESAAYGHSNPTQENGAADWPVQQTSVAATPRELCKVTLPRYVIEAPDILLIEAVNSLRLPETPLRPGETLIVRVANTIPIDPLEPEVAKQFKQINGAFPIQTDGIIDFGPEYGYVAIAGLTVPQARQRIEQHLKQTLISPQVYVNVAAEQARQHIAGEHLVRPDGTVSLGIYGSVYLAGMTLDEAKAHLERCLSAHIYRPEINVDVLAYNSKIYYVITDGAGAGEQVFRFPCTGNETILDAVSHINGLPTVASKKHIWIARPAPPELGRDQVLQVDWDAIVRRGQTTTNYQVLPGDRIYVRAEHMATLDTAVAKFISPFERIFGWTLLGNGTVRALQTGSGGGVGIN
ncbi:MAG: polysaccharide biosynthesis/export family protein [Planctomycetaceae bacterium]